MSMRRRNGKEYSCEPCRRAKTRCDHRRPICAKCTTRGRASQCIYHPAPMTTRRDPPAETNVIQTLPESDFSGCEVSIPSLSSQGNGQAFYPALVDWNLGSGLLSPLAMSPIAAPVAELDAQSASLPAVNGDGDLASEMLKLLLYNWSWYQSLIDRYFKISQVRLVPWGFADMIEKSTTELIRGSGEMSSDNLSIWAGDVTSNTSKGAVGLQACQTSSRDYYAEYTGNNLRWETVGIIFGLVATSTMLLPCTDPLFDGKGSQSSLTAHLVQASSTCLDLWRATGSISDISVLCIYQNLIATSMHYGDIDYRSWRRLVELSGAVFEAGLHRSTDEAFVSRALRQMRRSLFAAAYSIDKSLCTAFGRPSLISHDFCAVSLPLEVEEQTVTEESPNGTPTSLGLVDPKGWSVTGAYCPASWIRLRFILAAFGEKLERAMHKSDKQKLVEALESILQACRKNWESIPSHMKYPEATLENCSGRQRLMLASAYLHYLFLNFQAQREISPFIGMNDALVSVAQKILSLILAITTHSPEDGLLPRGFSWIIVFYGLPSAHVLVRELSQTLSRTEDSKNRRLPRGEIIRGLTSFLARLELLVSLQDGNSGTLQNGYQELVQAFDRAIDGLEVTVQNTGDSRCEDGHTSMVSPMTWDHSPLDISYFLE